MKHKEIADKYGLSRETVRRWPLSKHQQAIRQLKAGVNPKIAELVAEVQRLCYVASFFVGRNVTFHCYVDGDSGHFNIWHSDGMDDLIYVQETVILTEQNLTSAIAALNLIVEKY